MVCPFCNKEDTAVVDSRKNVDGDACLLYTSDAADD